MKIKDIIYGEEEVNENVLLDLINCPSVQRLKKINQYGLPKEYYFKNGFSRFEHSLGVLILLRKLNAQLQEQIAGLLHDVSHTAFSHVIDWVLDNQKKENFQDETHSDFILNSEIPDILKTYNVDFDSILEPEKNSLLEQSLPNICADRIDYSLRELSKDGKKFFSRKVFSSLINYGGRICFNDKKTAELFGKEYLRLNHEHWGSDDAKIRYSLLAKALKIALENKILCFNDFYKTDEDVLEILYEKGNNEITSILQSLKNKNFNQKNNLEKKFRYIDPEILTSRGVIPLSKISHSYALFLDKEKIQNEY